MFNYQYKYDVTFRAGYDARVLAKTTKQESILGTLTTEQKAQIAQGVKDGVITGTKDYVMSYYDLAIGIANVKFSDIYNGVRSSWNFVASSVTNLSATYESFKQTLTNIYDKINSLVYYDYSYGGSYVGTNIGLSAADPTGKIMAAAGGGFIGKIGGRLMMYLKLNF